VYVEFLLAFLPLFVVFLALCQIALLVASKLVVRHAALIGARAAIVVLDDDPKYYDGAERGMLSDGASKPEQEPSDGSLTGSLRSLAASFAPPAEASPTPQPKQRGPRMQVIRNAALRPLAAIAPSGQALFAGNETSLSRAVSRDDQAGFARAYSDAAAVVTIHGDAESWAPAAEPILNGAPITVRVTYLQLCVVPIVRTLMCHELGSVLDTAVGGAKQTLRERFRAGGAAGWLEVAADTSSRFTLFDATVTLPNQGARYEYEEADDTSEE
jgi:hypothetical protein